MARITCPDESTPEFAELSKVVGSSTLALFLWRKNNYLPLDKIDVDGKEEVNPLYNEVLDVIAEGDRTVALKAIARTLMPEFQDKYGEEEIGSTIDFLKQDLEELAEKIRKREQGNLQAEQSPTSIVLSIPTEGDPIIFNEEESTEIFNNLSFLSANYGPSEVLRLLNAKKEKIKAKIMADPDSVTEAEQQQATNIILLTKNWDTVVNWFKSQEPTFGLKGIEESNTEKDDSDIDVEDFTGGVSTYNKNAHDRGQKELASAEVIRVVQSLPQYKKLSAKEQKEVASGKRSIKDFVVLGSVLGLPVTGDFSKNWNLLSASLTGITDYNQLKEEIRNLSTIYPQFRNLYNILPEADNTTVSLSNTNLAAAFQQVMSMPEIPAVKLSMKIVGNSYTTKVFELGTKTVTNLINYFDADYASANPNLVLEDGSAVDIKKLVSLFTYGNETLASRVSTYMTKIRTPKYFDTTEGTALLNELFKFHKAIGIIPTNSLYRANKTAFKEFLIATAGETASLYTKLANSQDKTSVTELLSYLNTYQGSGPLKRLSDSVTSLVKFYGQFEREFASGSYYNPENKLQYNRVQYFYLTQISNTLNSVGSYSELIAKPEFAHLDIRKNPNVIGSLWLEKMFGVSTKRKDLKTIIDQLNQAELTGEVVFKKKNIPYSNEPFSINIQNYAGVSIAGNHKKNSVTTSLTPEDKILQDFFSFFSQGIVENVRFGDKGTSYATVLAGKPENRIYFKLDEEIMNQRETVVPQASNAVVEQFTEYLKSEAVRLKDLLRNPGKSTYHKNGKNLFIFKDILPEDLYSSLVNATTEEEIDAAYQNVKADLKTYLDEYIQQQTQAVKTALMEAVYPDDSLLPNPTTPEQRLNSVISRLNQKKFMDTGINKIPINANNFDYVIANYFINDFVHKAEFFKIFVGDIANFQVKGDYREVFKRIPFTSSPGYVPHDNPVVNTFLNNSPYTNGLQKVLSNITRPFRRTVRTVIFNDVNTFKPEDWEAYRNAMGLPDDVTYKEYVNNPKESDAQGLVTLDFYRNYLINIGQWSQEQEDAYTNEIELFRLYQEPQSEERDEQIADLKDTINYVGFPPLKLGHYGSVVEDPKLVALHKYSLAPLIPSMIQGTQLEGLNKSMLTQDIDYATFQSGSKASNYGESLDFYVEQPLTSKNEQLKLKVNEAIGENNVTTLHLVNLKQQQYIAPKFKNEATLATQMVKLLFGDFYSDGSLAELSPSFAAKIEQLYNDYGQSLRDLVGIEKLKLYNKLGLEENPDGSLSGFDDKKFISFLRTEMDNRNVSDSLKRYIQVDENGNLLYPLDSAKNRKEIEGIILSVINNRIISQKLHGEAYVQVASTGLGKQRFKKPTEAQIKKFGINGLRNYRVENGKTQPADVKIAFNPKKHSGLLRLKFDGKTIGTIENLNAILTSDNPKEMEWVEQNSKQLILVGVRIPVQGFNSMEYMRVREFLPTSAGPIIVVPAGIVAKSGGDFDIDKLTMFEPVIDRQGNLVETENYSLDQYKSELPTRQESVQLLRYLRQAKKEIQSIVEELPNYQKSKELQKEIQALKEALETKESTLLGMTGKTFNLEELQTKDLDREQKEAELKSKYAQIRNLLKEGEVAEGLKIFKELQREIFETENSNFNKFEAAAGNRLINVMAGVMSLEENYNKIVLPNTNTILKAEADKLPSNPITSTGVFNLLVSNRVYSDNIEAKKALSIDAKINTIQKEFQIAGLRYVDVEAANSYILPQHIMQDGTVALGMQNLVDGTSISRVISESINGHVDIAKEDWLILLGLDKVKTPLFHAMILSGTPVKESLEFLNRPIVKYALKEMNRGIIQSEMHYTKEQLESRRATRTLQNIFDKLVLSNKEIRETVEQIKNAKRAQGKKAPFRAITNGLLTQSSLQEAFFSEEASVLKDIASLAMLQNLRDRQSRIQQLNALVDYNTKSYQSSYQKEAEEFTYAQISDSFNKEGLDILTRRSALSAFNVADTVSGLLDKAFPVTGHRMVFNAINRFLNLSELYTQDDQVSAAKTVKDNLILLTIHSQGVDSEGNSVRVKVFGDEGFLTKNNSNNLLVRLKALKENYPDINKNLLIENLYEEKPTVSTPFLIFKLRNSNLDSYLINEYEKAFLEGMKDVRPEVSQFFKDLGLANFIQFGFSSNSYGLNQVVPFEAYEQYTTQADKDIRKNLESEEYRTVMTTYLAGMSYLNELINIPHKLFNLGNIRTNYPSVYANPVTFDLKLPELAAQLGKITGLSTQISAIIEGIEINSKQTGLGNDLTNVHYAIDGKSKFDIKPSDSSLKLTPEAKKTWGESVEAWYKSNNAKSKGIPEGVEGDAYDMKLMVSLITDKLKQYPNLVLEITNRGGLQFLEKSTHTMGNGRWSSNNPKNMFMNALKQAYQNITQEQGSVKPKIDLSKEWKGDLESRPVYTAEGVNTMRTSAATANEHFGNPWSEGGYQGTIKASSVTQAAQNYKDWLLGNKFQEIKPEQRTWILDQINQGKLDGANLLYSKKLMDRGQGSHAVSLSKVVAELRQKLSTIGNQNKPDVILPIGTSGSGKSTFIKSLPQQNLVVIEPDAMRVEFTGDINNKSKDKEIYKEAAKRAIQAIKEGKQVVFDTTNLTKEKRRPFITAIRKAIPSANIQYKLMELNPELAKERIKAQLARGEDRAAVSDETIDRHATLYRQMLEDIKSEGISDYDVQQSTNVNPLVEAGVKPTDMKGNASKDIQMAEESTQFIGFPSGNATVSSTNKYREAWGNKANTGQYTANDVVMVSGSGLFRGVTEAQIRETLTNNYKSLLEAAIAAGASFRVGNQYSKGNLSDKLVADYLKVKGYQEEKLDGYSRWIKPQENKHLLGEEVKPGIYVNQEALSEQEQLELFNYLKPFLEQQAAKTNKGKSASKMIGLGLRWDYKSNNPGKSAVEIPDVISVANKTKYGYYDTSINDQPLASITPRFRELIQKASGIDMTNYDGAIINLYDSQSFISAHNDVDESRSAIGYPVVGINLGGVGNFSIESRDGAPKQLTLKAGSAYVFGVDGVNREVFHRTFPSTQQTFLPELTTSLDGRTYKAGSYRVTITMRRVMPLQEGMPAKPETTRRELITSVETQEQKQEKIISNEDIAYFKTYVDKAKGVLPKEFFTSKTKFKEFFNPETGKREPAPQSSKWLLNSNNLYDLVDKDGGEVYITNVDLNTGIKYPNNPNNSLGLEESCDLG